jgi:hypothetical protein
MISCYTHTGVGAAGSGGDRRIVSVARRLWLP